MHEDISAAFLSLPKTSSVSEARAFRREGAALKTRQTAWMEAVGGEGDPAEDATAFKSTLEEYSRLS